MFVNFKIVNKGLSHINHLYEFLANIKLISIFVDYSALAVFKSVSYLFNTEDKYSQTVLQSF